MHTRPSGTVSSAAPLSRTIGIVTSPTRRTAAPSTNESSSGSVTGAPARRAAVMLAAPAGSTPITRMPGCRSRSTVATPASSPPPPTGTTTTSGARPSWSRISRPTVPCPAIVRRSSNAGTIVAPVPAAWSAAAAAASS